MTASGRTLALVVFGAGCARFAVEASQVRRQSDDSGATDVKTAESFLGLAPNPHSTRRVLTISGVHGDVAVSVAEPVELLALPVSALAPLPALIVASIEHSAVKALAHVGQELLVLVDLRTARMTDTHTVRTQVSP